MLDHVLPFCRFHLQRLWRGQPVLLVVLVLALTALLLAGALALQRWRALEAQRQELQELEQRLRTAPTAPTVAASAPVALPAFRSSALPTALQEAATQAKLPLDELSFSLEDTAAQPYLRYRVQFTVLTRYAALRSFLTRLREQHPEIDLDSLSCGREDIEATELSCELALSAYYRRGPHG